MAEKRKREECPVWIDDLPFKKQTKSLSQYLTDKGWQKELNNEFNKPYFKNLEENLYKRKISEIIYPPEDKYFEAFNLCPFDIIKVVIIGQDPYHNGSAMGIAFSVPSDKKINPSLQNIFTEIEKDTGQCKNRLNGDLTGWCKQGILLLNTVLSVKKGEASR